MFSTLVNRKKSVLFLTLISLQSFILAETAALSTQSTDQEPVVSTEKRGIEIQDTIPSAAENDQLERLLNEVLQQTNHIDALLQDMVLVASNNQALSKEQRALLAKEIINIRSQLSVLKNQSFTQANPQSIYLLLIINKELCDHLQDALAQGFTSLSPFTTEKFITRTVQQPLLTHDLLAQAILDNAMSIDKLSRSAASIGLTWYNKLYRGIDNYLIQPWQKHNITHYGVLATGATVITLGAWWLLTTRGEDKIKEVVTEVQNEALWLSTNPDITSPKVDVEKTFKTVKTGTPLEQWLRKKMGPHPLYYKGETKLLANREDLSFPGIIEHHWGPVAGAAALCKLYVQPYVYRDYVKGKNFITKKMVELHNNLKGGIFKNKTIKTSFEDYFKKPTCTFNDVIGAENAKEIFSNVIDYLVSPEKYDLAKITPEKGYLLTGPSRTGKTFIAEAFAGEVRKRMIVHGKNPDTVHFLSATHEEINYLGGIKELLSIAKFYAPCILFIDEIDLLGLQRGGNNSMLADFLVGLSDFSHQDSDKQVIVIAASNRSENLDDALKRRGRLGIEIRFTYPSFDYRKDFLIHKLESIGISTETLDIDSLMRQTVGKSFNDLESILKKALHNAKNLLCPLDQALLERAIDSEIFLILPEVDHPLSRTERELIAASIAGETLVNYVLDTGAPIMRATINPYLPKLEEKSSLAGLFKEDTTPKKKQDLIKYGKAFTATNFEFLSEDLTSEQIKNTCKQLLAGRCTQQILLGTTTHNKEVKDAMQRAYTLAKELVGNSIDSTMLSDKMRDCFADKAFEFLTTLEQETIELLTKHKDKLEQLTAVLLELNTINADVIAFILEGKLAEALEKEKAKEKAEDTTTVITHPAVA